MAADLSFGRWLQRRRKALDLTQADLGRRVGYARVTIHKIETDQLRPSQPMAERLADALEIVPGERPSFVRFARDDPRALAPSVLLPIPERSGSTPVPPPRHNLPTLHSRFVGRDAELAAIAALLRDGVRLLTLAGPPGMGKTRLALEVAMSLVDAFPDGVWLVDLAPVAEPELVPRTVALALSLRDSPGRAILDSLLDFCRKKNILLVLDNCEHLVDACSRLVDTLLPACPRLRILATSRETLGVAGEAIRRVPPLTVPASGAVEDPPDHRIVAALATESVQLFLDRARLVASAFAVTPANVGAVANVCRSLDGIPLALELAAARVVVLSVEQIVARLDQRFRLLTGGGRTALPRQQTLQALIDWSYDLLTDGERVVLRRLSVFVGGFSLDAAEAVGAGSGVGRDEVLDHLSRLVAKSLIITEAAGNVVRYRLLETIRQYADEKLRAANEFADARERHRAWYLALVDRGMVGLEGPDQASWFARLDPEQDNLRAALDWCQADVTGAESHLRLAGAMGHLWFTRRNLREGPARLDAALARSEPTSPRARALALDWAGGLARLLADSARAVELRAEGLSLARAAGDQRLTSQMLRHLAAVRLDRGEVTRARALLEEGLAVARASGVPSEIGSQLVVLALALGAAGAVDAAERLLEEGLVVARASDDEGQVSQALANLGMIAAGRADYASARAAFEECLAALKSADLDVFSGWESIAIGLLARLEGAFAEARRWGGGWLRRSQELGGFEIRQGLLLGASIAVGTGQSRRAAQLFSAAGAAGGVREVLAPDEWAVWLMSLHNLYWWPWVRSHFTDELAATRARLGEEEFARAWAEGQRLRRDEAIDLASTGGTRDF